ncbi:hypothetical protein AB0B51_14990 [Streptomyces griseus]|uniref:hypothetical protein n=1 Tax=Streptomyces griseus TaxID=1911 RepID=UPI0004CB7862|nr:hypothetical protein [Streptomyces griseus]
MPDRRRRTAFRLPLPERSAPLMRERLPSSPDPSSSGSSSPDSSSSTGSSPSGHASPDASAGSAPASGSAAKPQEDNPFAAPPADRPDQPWQPRRPAGSDGREGSSGADGNGGSDGDRPSWGSQWSSKQPGRGNGGFGGRPGSNGPGGPGGRGGPERGGPGGLRWDPTDPAQRRARYAVLGGMWAFFFALFDLTELALLLGALSTYWAISALRTPMKSASASDGTGTAGAAAGSGTGAGATADDVSGASSTAPAPTAPPGISSRQQTTAAVSGLVTALLALLIVATTYTVQLVYRDYYTCVNDSLTKTAALACNDQLPKPLKPLFGVKE